MSRHFPSRISLHRVAVISPPPERYDPDVARLLNDERAMKYLTHNHSTHPSFFIGGEGSVDMTWTLEHVRCRREAQENEHRGGISWYGVALEDDQFAGVCSLREIDWYNRSGEMGICLLPDFWHRAISSQTHFIILQHAFEVLHLHRISFTVTSENTAMISFCNKVLTANHEGTMKDFYLDVSGRYHNAELFSVLETNWSDIKATLHRRILSYSESTRHHHHRSHSDHQETEAKG